MGNIIFCFERHSECFSRKKTKWYYLMVQKTWPEVLSNSTKIYSQSVLLCRVGVSCENIFNDVKFLISKRLGNGHNDHDGCSIQKRNIYSTLILNIFLNNQNEVSTLNWVSAILHFYVILIIYKMSKFY